jgi:uncharacterized protein (DUF849 family)
MHGSTASPREDDALRHDRPVLLQACLNGARRPAEHPALPTTPVKLARDVAAVVAAGAQSVHLHVKDSDGNDTMRATELAEVLAAVQATAGRVPVGITTGAWAEPDPAARVAAVESWTALPDFASVDWHEDGADQVAAALLAREVGVEAGLWHADGAAAWLASPHRDRCLRVLIELPDGLDDDGTVAAADELLAVVSPVSGERPGSGVPGASAWRTSWNFPTVPPRPATRRWSAPRAAS